MKPNILIVDDELPIRKLLEFFLGTKYNIVVKENAAEALKWLNQSNVPDAIILDIQMPNLTGKEFLKIIANDSSLSNVPVIMLSGNEKSDDKIECLSLGADDYIVKPFNPLELEVRIDKIFKKSNKL